MRFVKASEAKKRYCIPDRIYRELIHGRNAIGFRPNKNGHYFFELTELETRLNARMRGAV